MGLTARNLTYAYPVGMPAGAAAVHDVSLEVRSGDLVVVAGTTGSGKSTLLRLLAGLIVPGKGTVDVDGRLAGDRESRGRVAIVFQNPESQFFAETLVADVAFGPRNLGRPDPEIIARSALSRAGLDPDVYGPRSPFTLSGGEARRAAIAGALALGAPYLLLDEPTAGLDSGGRRDVLAALAQERERAGVVVVTHDPEEFLVVASQILVLDQGVQAFAGPVDDMLRTPERYEQAGLRLPDIARIQLDARARGKRMPRISFDPYTAAEGLLQALRDSR